MWFKIFGEGGEALEREGELAFRPYGDASWVLSAYAINENGGAASQTLSA